MYAPLCVVLYIGTPGDVATIGWGPQQRQGDDQRYPETDEIAYIAAPAQQWCERVITRTSAHNLYVGCKGFRSLTKNWRNDKNWRSWRKYCFFWRNLLNFHFLTNKEWQFWRPIYRNKHSISDSEKMAKFGICVNIFDKVCTFWRTKSGSQKSRYCFGKTL